MRVLNKIVLGLLILIINTSCGRDGKDGEIFLRFRSILTPLNFHIENPDIPGVKLLQQFQWLGSMEIVADGPFSHPSHHC